MKRNCKKHNITFHTKRKEGGFRCNKCASESVVKRIKNKKKKLVELFGGQCSRCGYNKYLGALQFHHIKPKEKSFGIAEKYQSYSLERLLDEAEKCILLCANCHFEVEHEIASIA